MPDFVLDVLGSQALDSLFWPNAMPETVSAWHGHVPFAHWLVASSHPRLVVELGTHTGVSFAAFCEGAQRSQLPTRCFAVDTWAGDVHAGLYGEDVYQTVKGFVDGRYPNTATLVRSSFHDALDRFSDGAIDVLHIDGLHTYEAVRHDWETWRPKLSDQGVVLFHDTAVRGDDFGVWQLWAELRQNHAGFEFPHCFGLGVLLVGANAPEPVTRLCTLSDPRRIERIIERFAVLGAAAQLDQMTAAVRSSYGQIASLQQQSELLTQQKALLEQQLEQSRAHASQADAALLAMQNSSTWRATAPLRRLLNRGT